MNDIVPDSLVRYREALEEAIRRDVDAARARRRRKLAVRAVLAVAVVAAVALGALSIVSRPASGASVVRRAAAGIARSPGAILHVDMVGSQTNPDGSVVTWRDESWQQESPPYARRQLETSPDGSVTESASTDGREELWDPKTGTIYVSAPSSPPPHRRAWQIAPGPRRGTFVLQLRGLPSRSAGPAAVKVRRLVVSARQVKALREGADVVGFRLSRKKGLRIVDVTLMPAPKRVVKSRPTTPSAPDPHPSAAAFRDQILALLNSGGAQVAGHSTVDGQDTIEIESADGHTTYYVDPASYAPVKLTTRGTGGGTALRFRTYENLPFDANRNLLSLEAQHPTARIDHDPADYQAAQARLFPHG
jgi:hypothetical protein